MEESLKAATNAKTRQRSFDVKLRTAKEERSQHKERADSVERELKSVKSERDAAASGRDTDSSSRSHSRGRHRAEAYGPSASSQVAAPHRVSDKLQLLRDAVEWGSHALTDLKSGWSLIHHVCAGASPGGTQLGERRADGVEILGDLLQAFSELPSGMCALLLSNPTTGLPKPVGWTALRFLVNNADKDDAHRLRMIQMLIERKADTDTRMGADGVCVLSSATATSNAAAVNKLIECRADVFSRNTAGSTLVDYAKKSNKALKERLIALGVVAEVPCKGNGRHLIDSA